MAMPMATDFPWDRAKRLLASTPWPRVWPWFSFILAPVSNSSCITTSRFNSTQRVMTFSRSNSGPASLR